jgi:UDP-N-acetyl-D-galactosamine dehydrogenase
LPFKPGLVGGHCIVVDPYYLAQKAQEHGYHPEIILAGRRLNDSMGAYVASEVVKCMIKKGINVSEAEVLMLGITFKENCPDVRNTRVVDVIAALKDYGVKVSIYDPWANPEEVMREYGLECHSELSSCHSEQSEKSYPAMPVSPSPRLQVPKSLDPDHRPPSPDHHSSTISADHPSLTTDHRYDAVVLGVAHNEFQALDLASLKKEKAIVYDVKGILNERECDGKL